MFQVKNSSMKGIFKV